MQRDRARSDALPSRGEATGTKQREGRLRVRARDEVVKRGTGDPGEGVDEAQAAIGSERRPEGNRLELVGRGASQAEDPGRSCPRATSVGQERARCSAAFSSSSRRVDASRSSSR